MSPGPEKQARPGDPLEGGCLCGALRYRIEGAPLDAGYCHCRLCQRSTGAPVLAWASIPVERFTFTRGEPARYASTAHGLRLFCATCGTQLLYREAQSPRTYDVNLGSLDDPESIEPRYHIFTRSRIAWFDTADQLPRHEDEGPDLEG